MSFVCSVMSVLMIIRRNMNTVKNYWLSKGKGGDYCSMFVYKLATNIIRFLVSLLPQIICSSNRLDISKGCGFSYMLQTKIMYYLRNLVTNLNKVTHFRRV